MVVDALPKAPTGVIVKNKLLGSPTLVLTRYLLSVDLVHVCRKVLVVLLDVVGINHHLLQAALEQRKSFPDPRVRAHASGARLLQLAALPKQSLTKSAPCSEGEQVVYDDSRTMQPLESRP